MGLQLRGTGALLALLAIASVLALTAHAHQDCYASVGGALGHVFQFDGGHATTDPIANGCHRHRTLLLTRAESSCPCQFDIRARFGSVHSDGGKKLSQLVGIVVKMKGGDEFELKAGRHLVVNGHSKRVPHAAHGGVRVFYSGEDLVLVHKRCHFWVTYDGHWTATYRLEGSHYGGKVHGLAGNCNGRRDDEGVDASLSKWLSEADCQRAQAPHRRGGHAEGARSAGYHACKRVISGHSDVLGACVADFCAAAACGNEDLKKRILCADFYLHSRRSAKHHRPLAAWRHRSGCALVCPANQHFSPAANPCPVTCDSHFFGAPKHCFKLPAVEGCQCNRGFVLDGRRCVRPKHCECLARLCVDRMPREKCLRWRAHGRCRRYPEVMARFCRATCGQCQPRCRNQLSDKLCEKLRARGKCAKPFYRAVCQAACEPKLCHCPSSRRVVSKCNHRYKNRSVASLRWFPDVHGKCAKSVLMHYEPCGFCPRKVKTVLQPCNYCTGLRVGKRIAQHREQYGQRRCLRRVHSLASKCSCPPRGLPKVVSYTECEHHAIKIRILKLFQPAKHCSKCVRVTRRTVLDKIACPGRRTVLTKCSPGRSYQLRKEFHQMVRHCGCHWCLTRQRKIPCRCRRPVSSTFCSEGGRHLVTVTKSWRLDRVEGRCVRRIATAKKLLACNSHRRSWVTCNRHSCTAVRHATWHSLKNCKCVRRSASNRLGKCCCPHGHKKTIRVNHYWKKIIHVQYLLRWHKCHKRVSVTKIRIACPGPKQWEKCDGTIGARVFSKVWFEKKGNECIKRRLRRVAKIECRRGLVRRAGPCHIRRGVSRYRKIEFQFSRRREGTCRCVRLRRFVEEFCGCKKGKFLVTSKCPKDCRGGKTCGADCYFTKTYFYFAKKRDHYSDKVIGCHKRVVKRLRFPCCCPRNPRIRRWCHADKFVVKQVTYTAMAKGRHECHRFKRTASVRVRCLHGPHYSETKKLPHPKPNHYYLATYRWSLRNCRCVVTVVKRPCLKRCRPAVKKRFCDKLQRQWVTRRVRWELRGCCACIQRVSERRVPVRCSRVVRHSRHCDRKSGVLTLTATRWRPSGCGCVKHRRVRRQRCKCPKPIIGRPHCSPKRHAFVKRTIYWVLKSGQCLRRRRTKVIRVFCERKIRYKSVCKAKSGVKTVYISGMVIEGCRCVRQWSVHNRLRCNCDRENHRVKGIVHHYCDRLRNLREAVTHRYVLRKGCCVRRTRSRIRGFDCPPAYTEKLPCDTRRRIQLTLTHYSIKRNCHCVRALRKRGRKCGCPHGPKVSRRRFCRKTPGLVVTVTTTMRWSHHRQICVRKRVTRSHRVLCSQKTHYTVSKCFHNNFYVETKFFHVRRGCRCFKHSIKRKRNCHCKSILRRYKCPKHGYTRRLVTQVMRWDSVKKRCHTVRYVTRRIRCRCPKPSKRQFCHAGAWVTETTRFALRRNCCFKRVERRERKVHCPRVVRHRYTACDNGCHKRHIYTLEQRLHPERCACYFAVVKRRSCPCCCKKPVSKKRCIHSGTAWQRVTVTFSPLEGKQCGCQRRVSRYTHHVACSKEKKFTWLPCDRHACLSRQRVEFSVVRHCGCHRVSRFTGKRRVCCCRQKPRLKRYCSNSAIYERRVTWRLRHWRCIRRTRVRILKRWHCQEKPKVVISRCNRATCHQHLHTLVNRLDWPRCRCRRVVVNPRSRLCCCLQRPRRRHHCDSATSAWVTTRIRFKFSASRRVCLRLRRVTRVPVRCPAASRHTHRCNRHTCRRTVDHISFTSRHCRCVRRVTQTSHVCCCPPPRRQPPRCIRHQHLWLSRRIAWHLTGEQCVKRVTTIRRRVTCAHRPRASIHVLTCNRHTCRQGVKKTVWRLVGCSCVAKSHTSFRTCCCRPKIRSITRCERHKYVVRYTTKRFLDRSRYVCVNKRSKDILHRIGNCHGYERRGKCNLKTRHRTVRIVLRRVRSCRCGVYRRIVRRYLCSCPKPVVRRSKCNKASCHRSVVKVWFTSHGHWRRFKCQKHRRVNRIRCCCKRNPGHRVFCDRHSGDIMRKDWWTVFVADTKSCSVRHQLHVVKPLTCPESTWHLSKCNKRTGYKVKVCTSFQPVRHTCSCSRRVTKRRIICHCPPSVSRNHCTKDKLRVFVHTSWRISLHQNRCVKTVKKVVKHLACSKRRWRVKKCHHDCSGTWYYHKYRIRHCKCHRVTRTRRVKCCCPKPSRRKRCLGNQWLTVVTKFKLRKGHCVKQIASRKRTLWCKRIKVRVGHCDHDCNKRRVVLRFGIRQCKCVLIKRSVHVRKCCCPKPRRYKRCETAKGVIKRVKIVWRLRHGKCLKRRRVVAQKIVCHGSWSREGKCNRVTRHQKVVLVHYSRIGCRCHKYRRIQRLLCRCRPPYIVKEKCVNKWKRRVFKVTYRLTHPHSKLAKCLKHRQLWYTEPCKCPKPTHRRKCSSDGAFVVTCVRTWRLRTVRRHHHKQKVCVRRTTVRHLAVRCRGPSVRWSTCQGCHKKRTTVKFRVHHCKCRRHVAVRVFACNCAKKSYKRRHCDSHTGHIVHARRTCFARPGAAECSCHTKRWEIPTVCPRRRHKTLLTKRHCGLHRKHAWFSRYSIHWHTRRGCGCVRRRKTVVHFCRCQRGRKRVFCALDGKTIVVIRDSYRPAKKHGGVVVGCRHIRQVTKRHVVCNSDRPRVRFGGCNAHCKRSVSVTQCFVRRCHRRHCSRSALQLCCTPEKKQRRFCEKKSGKWVRETVTYRLVPSVPLLRDCIHDHILAHQLKIVSKTHRSYRAVHCPRGTLRETCDRRSGRWEKTRVTWRRVGCRCNRQVRRWRGKCKCPPKRIHWGPCQHRYKVKTVTWFVLRHHACKRHVHRRSYLCSCPKPRHYTRCDRRGAWETCHISYRLRFRQQRCEKLRSCRRRMHTCPAAVERRSNCVDCRRTIRRDTWRLNRRKCACVHTVRRRVVGCDCWKCHHSRSTVCQHGAFITRIINHRQRGERCVKVARTITRPVYCSKRRTKQLVPGTCVSHPGHKHCGYQKLMFEWRTRHGCKCVRKRLYRWVPCLCRLIKKYRERKFTRCLHGSVVLRVKIYYTLEGCKCVKRVAKHRRRIVCTGVKNHRGPCKPNGHGDTYWTKRVWHRQSNGHCGCHWRLTGVHRRICRCRPSRLIKLCVRDHIRRRIHVRYNPVPKTIHCRARRHIRDEKLGCPNAFTRRTKCHKCSFTVRKYAYGFSKCKCVTKLIGTHRLKCCCPAPVTTRHCDTKRHLVVSVTVSHQLRHHRCYRRRVTNTRRVHCGRTRPLYRVSKCVHEHRKITKTVRFTVACACRVRTTHYRQRCACPHRLIYHRGKCGNWFAHDVWFGFRLKDTGLKIPGTNKPVLKCFKVVLERRKRRCRCPKPYRRIQCRRDDREIFIAVSYKLHGNSCQRRRVVREHRLPCHKRPRLHRVIVSPCLAKHGYIQSKKRVYIYAKHCRCLKSTRVTHCVCNCLLKHGGKKRSVKCVGPNRLVRRVSWFVRKGCRCAKRVKTSTKVLHCPKQRKVRVGHCKRSTGLRSFHIYHLIIRHCKCVWRLVRRATAPCLCPKPIKSTRCHAHTGWLTVKLWWSLEGAGMKAHCVKHKRRTVRQVKCPVGRRVRRSGCDHLGYRTTTVTIFRLKHCRCLKRVERSKCRCRCPKKEVHRFCRHQAWVTVQREHRLEHCACRSSRHVSRQPVACPERRHKRGDCRRAGNGDKYRKLVWTSWRGSRCQCHKHRVTRRHLCGCDHRRRKRTACVAGCRLVSVTTERRLVAGRCRRVRLHRRTVRIRCGRPSVKRVCHKATGQLSVFVVRPYVKNCRCYRRVVKHTRRCGCHKGHKLVRIGKCNPHSCRQRLYFKREVLDAENEKCIWRRYHRHRVCCCHGSSRHKRCVHKLGYHVIRRTKMVLRHWHCVKRVTRTVQPIKCSWNATRRSRRLNDGVLKLVDCWHVRVGCDCLKRCRTVFRRYRCKKPSKRVKCHCSGGRCRVVTHLTHWRLSKGRCYRQTRIHALPTVCPANSTSRSLCNLPAKYGYYFRKHFTTWYQKACRCHRQHHVRRVVCRCWKPKVRRHCERHQGLIVTVHVSYRLKRGHCVKIVRRRSHQVSCGHGVWRYSHSTSPDDGKFGVYYKVFWRLVRSGCRCVKQHKRTPCRSRCPACTQTTRCSSNGSQIVTTKTCWHLVGCQCVRRVTTRRRVLTCPKTVRRVTCHHATCALVTVVKSYRLRRCRCEGTKRVSRHLRCCCPKPVRTRACIKGSVVTRVVTHRLINGRCHTSASERHRRVTCPHRRRLVVSGRCKHGKGRQRFSEHYWVRHGCKCVKRVQHRYKHCTCQYNVVDLIIAVDLHSKKADHKDLHNYRSTVAKFLDTLLYHFKYGTARVRTTVFVYNSAVKVHKFSHKHHSHLSSTLVEFTNGRTDLHGALKAIHSRLCHTKPTSGVKRIVLVITRGNHHSRGRSVALAEKIQRRAEVFVVGFGSLPKSSLYVKWLASKPRRLHYLQLRPKRKYHFLAARIFKRTCHSRCAYRRKRHVTSCHRDTCRQQIINVEWRPDQHTGKCSKRRRTRTVACCCLGRDSNRLLCQHGRLVRVIVSHKFDFHKRVCQRRVRRIDVSAPIYAGCNSSVRHRGVCRSDGWCRGVLVTRSVDALTCRCRTKRRRLPRVRCRCPPTRRWRGCGRDSAGRWFRSSCELTFRLSRHSADGCAKSRRCRRSYVVCQGQGRVNFHGRCHRRGSCRRRRGIVWHSIANCRCRRRVKTWSEVCCCKQPSRQYTFCDRHKHSRVHVHVHYRLVRGACRRVVRRVARPVACPTIERVQLGHKCHPHGLGFYRRVVKLTWRLTGCRCERQSREAGWRLCRCQRLHRSATKCIAADGHLETKRWWLAASGNRCHWLSRIVSRVAVTCSAQRRRHAGPCAIEGKGGRKFRKITIWWERRIGCECKAFHRSHTRLCACPTQVRRTTRCHSDHLLTISYYRYQLSRNADGHASCHLVRKSHRRRVTCSQPVVHHEKCHHGKRTVQVSVFRPKHCRCVAKVNTRLIGCKHHCRDLLPAKICRRYAVSANVQVCQKHPHIASRLCAKTCGVCCRSATSLVYSGKHCLTRQQPGTLELSHHAAEGLVIAKKTTFDACASACIKNPHCRAFDYVQESHVCHLLRIDRHSLGGLSETPGCLLFEKSCLPQPPSNKCPFRRVVKTLPCRCYSLFGKKQERLCYRKARVAIFGRCPHGSNEACRRNVVTINIPCSWCEDSRPWCRDAARDGKCGKSVSVRQACRHSCRLCKRHRNPHLLRKHAVGGCSKSGWLSVARGGLWYDRHLHLWRVLARVSRERCVQCPVGTSLVVGRCTADRKRKLTWVTIKRLTGHAGHPCKVNRHEQIVNCCGGGLDLVRSVGRCKRFPGSHGGWQRRVITRFTVQDAVHGHHQYRCVVKKHTELLACSPKCPRRHARRGRCISGKRIVLTRYFVTYPGSEDGHRCVPRKVTQSERCNGSSGKACDDKLSPSDCAAVKRNGLCGSLHPLCANTCGKCQ